MQDAYMCERSRLSVYQYFVLAMFKYIINVLIFISLFVLILKSVIFVLFSSFYASFNCC